MPEEGPTPEALTTSQNTTEVAPQVIFLKDETSIMVYWIAVLYYGMCIAYGVLAFRSNR